MFQSPGAILLKIGPLTIRWYGVMIASGFLLAAFFAMRKAKRWDINPDSILNCALCSFLGGIVGARLYFAALQWSYFSDHLMEVLALWNGGMSIHGGLIGGLIGGVIYCKLAKVSILTSCDIIGSVMPIAQAVGRWGNFFNSEAFGKPVDENFPLKLYIPPAHRPAGFATNDYFHPAFLYECIWDLLLFLLLYFFAVDRLRKYPGVTFFIYIAGYSLGRLLIEPMRTDSLMAFGMAAPTLASAVSLGIAACGCMLLLRRYWTKPAENAKDNSSQSSPK